MSVSYSITATRGDPFVQSFNLFARSGGYPIEDGDGVFGGNFPINPWQTSITITWTAPGTGAWKFLLVPIALGISGPPGRVT